MKKIKDMNLPIIITKQDAERLRSLIQNANSIWGTDAASLHRLTTEIDRAKIVSDPDLPVDVIAMNSTVELEDLTDGEVLTFTLVFPEQADISKGRISILAPLGMAMLGFRVGDEFEWPVPAGIARVRVRSLKKKEDVGIRAQSIA